MKTGSPMNILVAWIFLFLNCHVRIWSTSFTLVSAHGESRGWSSGLIYRFFCVFFARLYILSDLHKEPHASRITLSPVWSRGLSAFPDWSRRLETRRFYNHLKVNEWHCGACLLCISFNLFARFKFSVISFGTTINLVYVLFPFWMFSGIMFGFVPILHVWVGLGF